MKPLDPQAHSHIADWVRKGGVLLYSGRDDDPFQTVREWWNTDGNSYAAPSDHLFKIMGIPAGAPEGEYSYGEGTVYIMRHDPKEYVLSEGGDRAFVETVGRLYSDCAKAGEMEMKNSFYLERGPYTIAAVMNESVSDEPLVITGTLVDLFDPGAERLNAAQRRTGVVAELQIAQHRGLFREQGCRQGTLCITFRAGRRQRAFDAARWNRFVHIS